MDDIIMSESFAESVTESENGTAIKGDKVSGSYGNKSIEIEGYRIDSKNIEFFNSSKNRKFIYTDNYMIKIALNDYGKIENIKELEKYSWIRPYCPKIFYATADGEVQVCEAVKPFSISDGDDLKNK